MCIRDRKQYTPLTVAEQVISVFCGVKGHLDDVDPKHIADFENKIISKCKTDNQNIIESIAGSGKLDDDTEKKLTEIILELKKNYKN